MIFLFWIGFAIIVGVAANNRGRNSIGWGLLAVVISPLLAGLLLFAMPRRQSFSDIATLAMIEATPEGSRARQLLAQHEADLLRRKENSPTWLIGSESNRPWSPTGSSASNNRFAALISVWIVVLLVVGFGVISYKSKPQIISPVAVTAPAKPIYPTVSYERHKNEAQERQEQEAKWNAVRRGEISFCEAFKSDAPLGITCLR